MEMVINQAEHLPPKGENYLLMSRDAAVLASDLLRNDALLASSSSDSGCEQLRWKAVRAHWICKLCKDLQLPRSFLYLHQQNKMECWTDEILFPNFNS